MRLQEILNNFRSHQKKGLAVLLDPDKEGLTDLPEKVKQMAACGPDFFFVGGSLITGNSFPLLVEAIRYHSKVPVVIFPGSNLHIHSDADGILLLSLLSGRNPELLIGQHVIAAPILKNSGLEIIPTAYLLVDGGKPTTVSYISNTQPLPADKPEIAACTAMAGEMLGFRLIYLDAGSGAIHTVSPEMIRSVRANTSLPMLAGGGIRSAKLAKEAWEAGADCIVIGNALESQPHLLAELADIRNELNAASK
jgi:putative glycerol-1-phosphate prenyltransferase